jgi:hypothetical protein
MPTPISVMHFSWFYLRILRARKNSTSHTSSGQSVMKRGMSQCQTPGF